MDVSVDDGYDARIFRVLVACNPGGVVRFVLAMVCFTRSTLKYIVWCLAFSKSQILIQRPLWKCVGVCLGPVYQGGQDKHGSIRQKFHTRVGLVGFVLASQCFHGLVH